MTIVVSIPKGFLSRTEAAKTFNHSQRSLERDISYQQGAVQQAFLQHIGVYGFRRNVLLDLAAMPRSSLEMAENLEQLRALEAGIDIFVQVVGEQFASINTDADYKQFVAQFRGAR